MNPKCVVDKSTKTAAGRILLADDDDSYREGLAIRLRHAGFECICAADAPEAAEKLRKEEFDALLSDIYMPGNVGLQLIEDIPQIQFGLPVILMTGHPTMETALKSIKLSVAGYLPKPPDMNELLALLEGVVKSHRSYRHITGSRKKLEEWARQLSRVERTMRARTNANNAAPVAEYLQLMAANLVSSYEEMEQSLAFLTSFKEPAPDVSEGEIIEVMQRTIQALEQTKQCFKSKHIGQLRRELEALVKKYQPKNEDAKTRPEKNT